MMPTNSHDDATTGHDKQPRQAATSHDRATTSGVTVAAMSPPQMLTVEEAAQLLGVSPRTVQRRCQTGKLSAKQTHGEFGEVWEIDRAAVGKMAAKQPRQAATDSNDKPRQSAATATTSSDSEPRQATTPAADVAANRAAQDDADREYIADHSEAAPDFRARYIAQMEAENGFLKSQLEDANRNAAELRAALRKALEIAPRQLMAAPSDATSSTTNVMPQMGQDTALTVPATDAATPTAAAVNSPRNAQRAASVKELRPLWKVVLGIR